MQVDQTEEVSKELISKLKSFSPYDKKEDEILDKDRKREILREHQLKNSLSEEEIAGLKQDRALRLEYANKVFSFVQYYTKRILVIFVGYQILAFCVKGTPTSPINTLLGTTTIIIVGLLATVIKNLFPNTKK